MSRILAFSCTHFPYAHKNTVKFLKEVKKEYKCDTIVCLGDLFDFSALSQWDKEPDGLSNETEYEKALDDVKQLYSIFPTALCCFSNHDLRPYRAAAKVSLSQRFLKQMGDILDAPKSWKFGKEWIIDNIHFSHWSKKYCPTNPHLIFAKYNFRSSVVGHFHTLLAINYFANELTRIFGMSVGCLIDNNSPVFRYNESALAKPILGCGVIVNGDPVVIPMELGSKVRIK